MEIELRDLRYFLAVAQQESITKAAEYLFIAQPSLSRRMQKLESELNRLLFVRGSRKVTLTQAGELLKKRAEEMLQLYEKTQAELLADGESLSGDVYIGGGESCGVRIVARAAKQIQSKHPEVKFHFFSGDTHDVKDKLDKGLIDFGVFVEPSDLTEYDYIRLPAEDTWGVLMPKSSILARKESVTANDLKGLPLICSRHSIVQKALDEWFSASDCKPAVNVTYNLIYNASLMVEEGMGYAIGLDRLINTTGSDLCFRPLSPRLTARLVVAWKKHQVMSKASGAFLNALKKASEPLRDTEDGEENSRRYFLRRFPASKRRKTPKKSLFNPRHNHRYVVLGLFVIVNHCFAEQLVCNDLRVGRLGFRKQRRHIVLVFKRVGKAVASKHNHVVCFKRFFCDCRLHFLQNAERQTAS